MSLSRWLKDYLYIPLGGNRNATFGTYCCIVTISLIGVLLSGSWWVALIVSAVAVALLLLAHFRPEKRKIITTNLNSMNTMLLGGLWHGASWNFMIWGGLNGLGMVIHKIWKNWGIGLRFLSSRLLLLSWEFSPWLLPVHFSICFCLDGGGDGRKPHQTGVCPGVSSSWC